VDQLKKRVEFAVGERFVDWYNLQNGTAFTFAREGETPDLHYADGVAELNVEITRAYYDEGDAKVAWENARSRADAPQSWSGIDFDDQLADNISAEIAKKCKKTYPVGCILVVDVRPRLTDAQEMASKIGHIVIPPAHSFSAIYLTGIFPQSSVAPGYYVWHLA
jgi:hypothetical protein